MVLINAALSLCHQHTTRAAAQRFTASREAGQLGEHQCLRRARASAAAHERVATTASIEGSTATTPSTRPQHQRSQNSHGIDRGPLPGRRLDGSIIKPGLRVRPHLVALRPACCFHSPSFLSPCESMDLPIIPTGTAFGMGLNAGAACYCGAMEVLGATRDAGDDGIIVAPVTAVAFMSVATRFGGRCSINLLGSVASARSRRMCATLYVKLRRLKVAASLRRESGRRTGFRLLHLLAGAAPSTPRRGCVIVLCFSRVASMAWSCSRRVRVQVISRGATVDRPRVRALHREFGVELRRRSRDIRPYRRAWPRGVYREPPPLQVTDFGVPRIKFR